MHCKLSSSLFIFLLIIITKDSLVNGQCSWNLNTDLPAVAPIYTNLYDGTPGMVIPTANGMQLAANQMMTLVCPGSSNTIVGTGQQEINVTCTGQNMVLYNGQAYALNSLYCSNNPSPSNINTMTPCGTSGTIMQLGYATSKGFIKLINVCYDRNNEANIYSTDILYGKALPAAEIDNNRPSFRTTGLTYGTTAANCYKQTEQLTRFTQLLGATQANKYITSTSYLARGHIAPDGDFLFATWASASYYLVNAAPQWQTVNAGNWLKVENTVRDIATNYQENIVSMTGTSGVLQLPNGSGQLTNIYLLNQALKVPKWFYKVVYSEQTRKGIAFVTINNPFITSLDASQYLCPNICSNALWNIPEFSAYNKGFTICCDVNVLMNAVGLSFYFDTVGYITGQ